MGKGDKKSRKGKIAMGSHGVSRPAKKNKSKAVISTKVAPAKSVESSEEKALAPKKVAAKKVAPKKAAKKAE